MNERVHDVMNTLVSHVGLSASESAQKPFFLGFSGD